MREISAHADACIPASERAGDVSERPELEAVDEWSHRAEVRRGLCTSRLGVSTS